MLKAFLFCFFGLATGYFPAFATGWDTGFVSLLKDIIIFKRNTYLLNEKYT